MGERHSSREGPTVSLPGHPVRHSRNNYFGAKSAVPRCPFDASSVALILPGSQGHSQFSAYTRPGTTPLLVIFPWVVAATGQSP